MSIVERAQQGFLLVIAAQLTDGALRDEPFVKVAPALKSGWAHACGRANGFHGFFRIGDDERPVFATQKTCGVKGLQFLPLAQIESLADIDEGGNRGFLWAKCSGYDRADMGRGDGLWRRLACVPLVLMARVHNGPNITRPIEPYHRIAFQYLTRC